MKRILLIFYFVINLGAIIFANPVEFRFSAGSIDDGTLKTIMENNISALLTEINRAGNNGTALNLTDVNMESEAKERLMDLWNASRFVCDKQTNISKCLNDIQGYQARAISITMKPIDPSCDHSINRELVISLDKGGNITGVRLALESQEDVSKIMSGYSGVDDTRKRREILKWIEDYQSYYYERNIQALSQIFNEDNALIITDGKTVRNHTDKDSESTESKVRYLKHSWESYMKKLSRIFTRTRRINVEFDHISVVMHGVKPNIYGVTLHQKWQTSSYSDEGWLFLLWDFNDPEKPQIPLRAWQPNQIAAEEGVFTLDDFIYPY